MCKNWEKRFHDYLAALCELHRCDPEALSIMYSFSGESEKLYRRFVYEGSVT